MLRSLTIEKILSQLHASHDVFDLEYERLLEPDHDMYERMFEFLGVEAMPVTWLKAKKILPPPEQFISNYAKLVRIQQEIQAQVDSGKISPWLRAPVGLLDWAVERRRGFEAGADRRLYP